MANIRETLSMLHIEEFTGKVTLQRGDLTKVIFFRKGTPVHVESNIRSETLGQILLTQGKITDEQYRQVLNVMETSRKKQGEVFVELKILSAFQVFEALQEQVIQKFQNAFTLENAELVSEEGDRHLIGIMDTPVDFFRTLLDLNYALGVGEKHPDLNEASIVRLSNQGQAYLGRRSLQPKELKLIRLLNGKYAVRQIMDQGSHDESEVYAILETLFTMKLLEVARETEKQVATKPEVESIEPAMPSLKETTGSHRVVDITDPTVPVKSSPIYSLALRLDQPYFKLLGIPQQSNKFQSKKAFDEIVRQFHLDAIQETYQGEELKLAEKVLDRLTLAYTVLADDKKKHEYLSSLSTKKTDDVVSPKVQAEVAVQKAHLFIGRKKYVEAEAEIRKALEIDPQESSYHVDLAELYMVIATSKKEPIPMTAEQELKLAMKKNPSDFRAYFQLGVYFKLKNDLDKARGAFQKVTELKPNEPKASAELRLLSRRLETQKKSESTFLKLFKKKEKEVPKGKGPKKDEEDEA